MLVMPGKLLNSLIFIMSFFVYFAELQKSHEQRFPPAADDGDPAHEQRLPGHSAAPGAGVSAGSEQRRVRFRERTRGAG